MKKVLLSMLLIFTPAMALANNSMQMKAMQEVLENQLSKSHKWIEGSNEIYFNISDQDGGFKISDTIEFVNQDSLDALSNSNVLVFTLDLETFKKILDQDISATAAFTTGKLAFDFLLMVEAQAIIGPFNKLFIKIPESDGDEGWCC